MEKFRPKATFKRYDQDQMMVLPPSLDELISRDHLVRVVDRTLEEMDLTRLYDHYKGGGTSSYDPKMILKEKRKSKPSSVLSRLHIICVKSIAKCGKELPKKEKKPQRVKRDKS